MARLICLLTSFLLALPSWAHFLLNYPPSIGFDDSLEGTAPCGGFTPDFGNDTVTDFFAGGSAIALSLAHPQANWLFRGTLDHSGAHNWVALFPIVEQSGLGNFCEPAVPVPDDWVGQKGLIGVVADALDGLLYQCAAVSFVAGTVSPSSSICGNGTGISGSFTSDPGLAVLVSSTSSPATSPPVSSTTSSTTESTSSNSPPVTNSTGSNLSAGAIAGIAVGSALGGILLCAALFLVYQAKKRATTKVTMADEGAGVPGGKPELDGRPLVSLTVENDKSQVVVGPSEIAGIGRLPQELQSQAVYELPPP